MMSENGVEENFLQSLPQNQQTRFYPSIYIYNPNSLSKAIWAPQLGAGLMSNPPVSAIKLNVSPTLGPWTHECETIGKSKMHNSL